MSITLSANSFSVYSLRFLLFFILTFSATACAMLDPLQMAAGHKTDPEKAVSLEHANHRLNKRYDLLEKSLVQQYEGHVGEERLLGQLYAAIDLADFYAYGLINYRRSLEYYEKVDQLNRKLNEQGLQGDRGGIVYYKAEGNYALPRTYDFNEIAAHIQKAKEGIRSILGENSRTTLPDAVINKKTRPEITTTVTDQYAYAIQVTGNTLDPADFDAFEQELLNTTTNYFKYRHKLTASEKGYNTSFNASRCLIKACDIASLPTSHIERILAQINQAEASLPSDEITAQKAYLDFGKVLCMSRLGRHKEAIQHFTLLQERVKTIQSTLTEYINYLKESRKKAITRGIIKTGAFLAIDVITMGMAAASGGGICSRFTGFGLLDLAENVPSIQRKIALVGESQYSQQMNLVLNMDEQLQLFTAVGRSYHELGDLEKSIFYNKESLNIINNLRSTISSETGRIGFAKFKEDIYNNVIDDLAAGNKADEALFYAENSRSRALVDLLGSKTDITFRTDEESSYLRRLRDSQIYRDAVLKQTCIADDQAKYVNDLQRSLETDQGNTRAISIVPKKDRTGDPRELLSLTTVSSLKVFEIQALLPKNLSLIEYYVSGSRVYAWVIGRTDFSFVSLNITPTELKDEVHSFIRLLRVPGGAAKLEQLNVTARLLFNKLYEPLQNQIRTEHVVIIGHGLLHFLPFEALHDGTRFLVERYSFSYLPSASVMQFLKPAGSDFGSILALGNPETDYLPDLPRLQGAERESQLAAELFPINKVYLRRDATESALRREGKDCQVLHVACHGFFDNADALNSRLLLSSDMQHDGVLHAVELYGIDLNASLVTLSACETGMSVIENGDELLGLIRGFFFAGASSLVASLWKVGDEATGILMPSFYNHLKSEGQSIAKALQLTKIDMIRNTKYKDPFFWAAFNLNGLGI